MAGRKKSPHVVFSLAVAWILLLGCNLEIASTQRTGNPAQTPTPSGNGTAGPAAASGSPGAPTPSGTAPADTPAPTPTFTVLHLATPPGAAGTTRYITDPETKDYAPQKKSPAGSDVFARNRYERPYTAETMEYLSDVDLTRVEMKIAAPWVYITFAFAGPRAEGIGRTMYGAEFDVDRDGRGDFLVWGASPAGAEWTADGVEVREDTNSDVGGAHPQLSDVSMAPGDGYDRMIFSGGQGADPDLAWTRQIEGGSKVQLAFKYSAIGSAAQFLWNGLADSGVRNPEWFDYNDHFTPDEAGSPLTAEAGLYPLRALSGIDNTCRDAYGFTPTGSEPGLCLYYGSISGTVAWDIDHDGTLSAVERSTAAISGDMVTLGQGACPAAGYKTAVSDALGGYAFADLPIGTYCVRVIHSLPWPIEIPSVTVILSPGESETVDFPVPW
jgi:hypothetical protein